MIDSYDWGRLAGLYSAEFVEKMKGLDGKACWKGYKLAGTKKKGNRTVDDCVKIDSKHTEGDIATAEMTPNYLPKTPVAGEKDLKNPQMSEGVPVRMPRDTVIKKLNNSTTLSRVAAPNNSSYSEILQSTENNGGMVITQLRVAQEKIQLMLDQLTPEDNLPPWAATKIANAGVGLASVGDYIRFGEEG